MNELSLKCAVITPIGPGHEEFYQQCLASIKKACEYSRGIFESVIPMPIDDTQGKLGRSHARNQAIKEAHKQGVQWIFFLDADDFMVENAFELAAPYMPGYDGIWGQIYEMKYGEEGINKRQQQLEYTESIDDVLFLDPYFTLQMGHFVKTSVAVANLFDEALDTGEDFHYYLRVWEHYRAIKIAAPLFVNRRGAHSTGPRSADGQQWRVNVEALIGAIKEKRWGALDGTQLKKERIVFSDNTHTAQQKSSVDRYSGRVLISIVDKYATADLHKMFFRQLRTLPLGRRACHIRMQAEYGSRNSKFLQEYACITPYFSYAEKQAISYAHAHQDNLQCIQQATPVEYMITLGTEVLCMLPQWVEQAAAFMDNHPDVAMMAPLELALCKGSVDVQQQPATSMNTDTPHLLSTAFAILRVSSLAQAGFFDDALTAGLYEDVDLCLRLKAHGFKLAAVPIPAMLQSHKNARKHQRLPLHNQATDSRIQQDRQWIIDRWARAAT